MAEVSGSLSSNGAASPWIGFEGGSVVVVLSGSFVATAQLQIKSPSTDNPVPLSVDGSGTPASYSTAASAVVSIPAVGMEIRVALTGYTSGAVNYDMLWQPSNYP